MKLNKEEAKYLVFSISIKKQTYNVLDNEIIFLKKNNKIINLSEIKNEFNIDTQNSKIIKHYICYPEESLN